MRERPQSIPSKDAKEQNSNEADERFLLGLFGGELPQKSAPIAQVSQPEAPLIQAQMEPEKQSSAPFGAEDHRARMRTRFEKLGGDALDDYELLEMALFRSLPRRDTRPIAKMLLKRFGSMQAVFAAPTHLLKEIDQIGDAAAHDLRLIGALYKAVAREDLRSETDLLSSWDKVLAHCRAAFSYEREEQFHVLFLNKRNGLIADETLQHGTVDHTPVYPREIVKRALELSASAMILVHNHPSGDPTPSTADIDMTKRIIDITRSMDIVVHDHLIIGANGYISLKAEKLI